MPLYSPDLREDDPGTVSDPPELEPELYIDTDMDAGPGEFIWRLNDCDDKTMITIRAKRSRYAPVWDFTLICYPGDGLADRPVQVVFDRRRAGP